MFSIIAINILFLLFPGIISKHIINMFTHNDFRKEFNFFILDSFVLGTISYILVFLIKRVFNKKFHLLTAISKDNINLSSINFFEIIYATIIAIIIALIYSYIKDQDLIYKLARKINFSNRSSNSSIFYNLNINKKEDSISKKWALIKLKNFPNREYQGYINIWAIHENHLEILLKEVTVFDSEGEELSEIDSLYLKSKYEDIIIKYDEIQGGNSDE